MKNFLIVIPVYNDWDNLNKLLKKINIIAKKNSFKFSILVINDFSNISPKINFKKNKNLNKISILNLDNNLGSQRAIAIALKYLHKLNKNIKQDVIIMDADGQDNPYVIKELIDCYKEYCPDIVVVERTNRNEPFWFKFLYFFHKTILFLFTGNYIKFGNFSLINSKKIKYLINKSDLWAAYPAAIVNNLKNIKKIQSERKKRYSGNSKVNFYKLFNHSCRVFSVFKFKILIFSLIYSLVFFIFFQNNKIFFYIFFIPLLISNVYNFYIDFTNKKNFKDNINFFLPKLKKIF